MGHRWTARACLGAGLLALAFYGCHASGPGADSPSPGWLHPGPSPAVSAPAEPLGAVPATVASADGNFDPSTIVPLVDDPRLSEVKALVEREAYRGAAEKLAPLVRETNDPSLSYLHARLRELAGEPFAAARAYDQAAGPEWVLSDHARFHAARLWIELGEPAQGLARLSQPNASTALDDEILQLRARAHADAGQVDQALPLYLGYFARAPRPRGWQQHALRITRALLNQPSVAHAEQAVAVARMVIYESDGGRGVGEARELEQQALLTIPSARRKQLVEPELAELASRARGLSDARQAREAMAAADQLIDKLGKDAEKSGEIACEAYLARCKGLGLLRRYSEGADACGVAAERCEKSPRQVVALFLGGRYALRGGKHSIARKLYAALERAFPDHSYADDARLHGAQAALDLGDVAAYTRMLSTIADDYPEGDMVDDALFALARATIDRGDWAGAVVPLERSVAVKERGRPYYAEGRPQYFLARARLELGQKSEGIELLESVIRKFPLSYYMVQAFARLLSIDRARARAALEEALKAEPSGDFVIPDHPELHRPAFLRAIALVRQGDGEGALAELETLGVRDRSAHPAMLWASAFLLARIEAPSASHGLLRGSTDLWQAHYPAGVWRPVWEVAYPRAFAPVVERETKRYGLPQHLVFAVMREESAFDPRVVSHADAHGLMQLIVPTAKVVAKKLGLPATPAALKRPEVNVALGCRYLDTLTRKFDYNPLLAIPGYNAGPGAPARWVSERPADDFDLWVERIPYTETRRYTKRVIASMAAYAALYGEGMQEALLALPLAVQPGYSLAQK